MGKDLQVRIWLTVSGKTTGLDTIRQRITSLFCEVRLRWRAAMDVQCYELRGLRIAELPKNGDQLRSDRQAIEIISEVATCQPELIVIPVERFSDAFFCLKTRVAGDVLQKFVAYRKRVVVLGDIPPV